jgi:hypothetical protein
MAVKQFAIRGSLLAIFGMFIVTASGNTPVTTSAAAASTLAEQLRYAVHHSVFGDIGTYTNIVQRAGDMTTVRTTAHFLVKMLGVGLHREDAERTEQWSGGRLVSFNGVTKKNDQTTQVQGRADGGDFVITSPLGKFTAPASVQPANPWSAQCLKSTTMMRVDNGKIEQVRVTGGGPADVVIGGATVATRQYEIDGASRYKVWFDKDNIPVMFAVDDDSGKITFTLEK